MGFVKNSDGTTAVMVAVLLPVIVGASGAALDASYATMLKGELTQITKMACSRLATSAARTASATEQTRLTGESIDAHLAESRLDPDLTEFVFTPASGGSANVSARSIYETKFMQILGVSQVGIASQEQCAFELRLPTARPMAPCDGSVYTRSVGTSASMTLAQARQLWQDHNETCVQTQVQDGGYTDANGNWVWNYTTVDTCTPAPAPDEMIMTVISTSGDTVYARSLLSDRSDRGETSVSESGMPGSGRMTLQPLNGYPMILPEACDGSVPVAPPPPPPSSSGGPGTPSSSSSSGGFPGPSSSSGGGRPTSSGTSSGTTITASSGPPGGDCESGGGSMTVDSNVSAGSSGSGSSSFNGSVSGGCGAPITGSGSSNVGNGQFSGESTFSNGNETSTSSASGNGNGVTNGGFANGSETGAHTHGPSGGVNFGGVDAWLP